MLFAACGIFYNVLQERLPSKGKYTMGDIIWKIKKEKDEKGLDESALREALKVMCSRLYSVDKRTKQGKLLSEAIDNVSQGQHKLYLFLKGEK